MLLRVVVLLMVLMKVMGGNNTRSLDILELEAHIINETYN